MIRRLLAAIVLMVPAMLLTVSIVEASGPGTMIWTGHYWKDPACGTDSQLFRLDLFRDINYGGTKWRFCSNAKDLCWWPHGQNSSDSLVCQAGWDADTVNDYPSSLKVLGVGGGDSCRIVLYDDPGYHGASVAYWDPVDVPDLRPWPNDAISSLRRVCG